MSSILSKDILEEIRRRNDIVEVVSSYFNLKRAGSSYKALCPFHKEKTPSFNVCPRRQIFHCFGCGEGGDVFRFVMKMEGVNFVTAVKMLAQRVGISLKDVELEQSSGEKTLLLQLHAELAEFYHSLLKKDATALQYLKKRNIPDTIVEQFMIGYAPPAWDTVLRWATQKRKYSIKLLESAGLIIQKEARTDTDKTERFYDRFRNRIMFPVWDQQGRVIAFSGRTLEEGTDVAKYVNSPETILYQKGRVLYALHLARRHILDQKEAIICEGQIDVIRCHQAGFCTAVAPQGTAFTSEHARILQRYTDAVCLVFDPDKAGENAAVRTACIMLEAGIAVRVATLPKGEDPDEFIQKRGADAFRAVLNDAGSIVRYMVDVLSARENINTQAGLTRVVKSILEVISYSSNPVQRTSLVNETAYLLNLPPDMLQQELSKIKRTGINVLDEIGVQNAGSTQTGSVPGEELALCEHLVHAEEQGEVIELVRNFLPLRLFSSQTCKNFASAWITAYTTGQNVQDIIREQDDEEGSLQKFAAKIQLSPVKVTGEEFSSIDAVKDLILRIWRRWLLEKRREISRAGDRNTPDQQWAQLTADIKTLNTWNDGVHTIEIYLTREKMQ
jgi:DNA primase